MAAGYQGPGPATRHERRDADCAQYGQFGGIHRQIRQSRCTGPDARSSLLDEWHKDADDLVVIMGRNLFNSLRLPVLNSISMQNANAELFAGQLIVSTRTIGGLDVPCAIFPGSVMLITSFSNLSVYWQKGPCVVS